MNGWYVTILTGVISSLVATVIVILSQKYISARKCNHLLNQMIIVNFLLILLISISFLFSTYFKLSNVLLIISIQIFIAGILSYLYLYLKKEVDIYQYSAARTITVNKGTNRDNYYMITIHRLIPTHDELEDNRLIINQKTFMKGVSFLFKQINNFSPKFDPDLIIGVNTIGLLIATSISPKLNAPRLGYVTTDANHQIKDILLPRFNESIRNILIVDAEVKKGRALKYIIDRININYLESENKIIKIAVLTASNVQKDITTVTELKSFGVFSVDDCYLPDFFAYYSRIPTKSFIEDKKFN